jgi:hypothetical protein
LWHGASYLVFWYLLSLWNSIKKYPPDRVVSSDYMRNSPSSLLSPISKSADLPQNCLLVSGIRDSEALRKQRQTDDLCVALWSTGNCLHQMILVLICSLPLESKVGGSYFVLDQGSEDSPGTHSQLVLWMFCLFLAFPGAFLFLMHGESALVALIP